MLNKCPNEFVIFIDQLADHSEKITMEYFRKNIEIDAKSDDTPVTIADRNCEMKIRDLITNKYPDHNILGEEFENKNLNSEFTWVIDPIDGTRSYIAGHKDFGTLIALLHNNIPILGIINCPAHNERWLGKINEESSMNGEVIRTSKNDKLEDCYAFTSGLYFEDDNFKKVYDRLIKKTKYHRFGGDCYMYGMLASGLIEIVVEDTLKVHDYMALIPVIEGAGGCVSDRFGKKINLESDGSIVASSSKIIHKEVIQILNS
ncbi:MAG: histidinol phosphate phosphatase [Pelagibacteraceae bacterium]|nr:histidinol phosphate phosphatase [Pelagibacteraceae bacterium]